MTWQVHGSGQAEESGHSSGSGSAHEAAEKAAEGGGTSGASAGKDRDDAEDIGHQGNKTTGMQPPPRHKAAAAAAGTPNHTDVCMMHSHTSSNLPLRTLISRSCFPGYSACQLADCAVARHSI